MVWYHITGSRFDDDEPASDRDIRLGITRPGAAHPRPRRGRLRRAARQRCYFAFCATARHALMLRFAFLLFLPAIASAQSVCQTNPAVHASHSSNTWSAPFDRTVTLRAREISLREALDRVAAAAGLRFSYSSESLSLDRRVCVFFEDKHVGDALAELLQGTGVQAVSAGGDQVVLVAAEREALPEIIPLEQIVVTGSTTGIPRRSLTVAVDVIQGKDLEHRNATSISDILRASVPGMWPWQQSPSNLLTQYGSVRGASSFGLTYPKIYLDGIELANPLLLTRLTPSSIERIEAIRGPQGAALYGADAISGVINVVTRNAGFDSANRGVGLASNLGVTSSEFSSGTVVRQQYTLDYQTGSNIRSFGLTVAGSESDEFFPDAYGRDLSALARFRAVREHLNINATARLFAQEAGNGISPLLIEAIPIPDTMTTSPFLRFNADPQQVLQYTLGGTLTYARNERWTHMLVAGFDGYELDNVANVSSPWPTPLDSALQAARGGATRITFRGSSTARIGNEEGNTGSFTIGLEHSQLRKDAPEDRIGDPGLPPEYAQVVRWQNNTGLIGQFTGAVGERWYLSTGLRLESNQALNGGNHVAGLPMLGAAYVNDFSFATMKI